MRANMILSPYSICCKSINYFIYRLWLDCKNSELFNFNFLFDKIDANWNGEAVANNLMSTIHIEQVLCYYYVNDQ